MSDKTKLWIKSASVRAIKTVAQTAIATIGTSAAMFIAQALHLQNAGSAGTIALLTIVTTKWETGRLTIARLVTFAISVLLVLFIFVNIHIDWIAFGLYMFFVVLVCLFFI